MTVWRRGGGGGGEGTDNGTVTVWSGDRQTGNHEAERCRTSLNHAQQGYIRDIAV